MPNPMRPLIKRVDSANVRNSGDEARALDKRLARRDQRRLESENERERAHWTQKTNESIANLEGSIKNLESSLRAHSVVREFHDHLKDRALSTHQVDTTHLQELIDKFDSQLGALLDLTSPAKDETSSSAPGQGMTVVRVRFGGTHVEIESKGWTSSRPLTILVNAPSVAGVEQAPSSASSAANEMSTDEPVDATDD